MSLTSTGWHGTICAFCGAKIEDEAGWRRIAHEKECVGVPYPGFCYRLPACIGRSSCPRDIACND